MSQGLNPKPKPVTLLRRLKLLALAGLILFPLISPADEDDDAPSPPPASRRESTASPLAEPAVRLSDAQQKISGLALQTLKPATISPEFAAYGKVLDIQPLLELRTRYRAALSEAAVSEASLGLARKNKQRLTALHKEDIIAERELVHAEALFRGDQAKDDAARRMIQEIRGQARQSWGEALTRLALDGDNPVFEDLVARRRVLLLIVLPAGSSLPEQATLYVARDHDRAAARRAEWISVAPVTDDLVQGETFFFHTEASRLRAGMRVNAWAPLEGESQEGVVVPLSAVVWQDGKPWVYRQSGAETYVRIELSDHREYGGGWFVSRGLAAGDKIVVTGGQMLLSEELRGQIPDDD